jgi:hypothetical protein
MTNQILDQLLLQSDSLVKINKYYTSRGKFGDIKSMTQKSCRQNDGPQMFDALVDAIFMNMVKITVLKKAIDQTKPTNDQNPMNQLVTKIIEHSKTLLSNSRNKNQKTLIKQLESETKDLSGNLTNIFNRLRIIAVEDIGIGDPTLVLFLDERLTKLNNAGYYTNPKNWDQCLKLIDEIVTRMTGSGTIGSVPMKCRLPSHLRAAKWKVYQSNHKDFLDFKDQTLSLDADPISTFKKLVLEKNDNCFYYWFKLVFAIEPNEKKDGWKWVLKNVREAETLLNWIVNQETSKTKKQLYSVLSKWFSNVKRTVGKNGKHGEFWIFGVQIISLFYMVDENDVNKVIEDAAHLHGNYSKKFEDFLKKDKLVMKDVYLDMHTTSGKASGSNYFDFVNNGALVVNEMTSPTFEFYKRVYNKLAEPTTLDLQEVDLKKCGKKRKRRETNHTSLTSDEEDK